MEYCTHHKTNCEVEDMNKKAFVTGASRGIGKGIVMVLAEAGYDIAMTYYSEKDEALEVQEAVIEFGVKCFIYQASLHKDQVAESITLKAIEDLGGIDVLVCNAGMTKHPRIFDISEEDIDFLYKLNYRSYMMCTKVAANHMIKHDVQGSIVFISSTRGVSAHEDDNIYGSLKAGLNRSVQSLALELCDYNINVNAVAPGATLVRGDDSPKGLATGYLASKVPMKRLGSTRDVGHLVQYLVSPHAKYITGETVRIDGGLILPGVKETEE